MRDYTFNNRYLNKTVLVTGITGFKGAWLAMWLKKLGANVIGVGLSPEYEHCLFNACNLGNSENNIATVYYQDICKLENMLNIFNKHSPDFVFHLAAKPLVKYSYENPVTTFTTNAIGTMNILECIRLYEKPIRAVMITSDKCYNNVEQIWGYRENDEIFGQDPYSASKSMAEMVIHSYRESFFKNSSTIKAVASVRAGNVIGGGDFSIDRLVPDTIKSMEKDKDIIIRNRYATRPWEHVLEPLAGYLKVGQMLVENQTEYQTAFNFGPPIENNRTVAEVVEKLKFYYGSNSKIVDVTDPTAPHECKLLFLDATKAYRMLDWKVKLSFEDTLKMTADWYKVLYTNPGKSMYDFTISQIEEFISYDA